MKSLIVEEKYNKKRLNTFLLDKFDGLSINTIYKALRKKDIRINNIKISENVILNTGDEVKLFIVDGLLSSSSKQNFEIVYEDSNILIVNKPLNIEVTGENSLSSILQAQYQDNGVPFLEPCHRLDRNTCGLVLYAKNEPSLSILLNGFKNREIEKHYRCIVYNLPKNKKATLNAYLFKDKKKSQVYISDIPMKGYQKITTSYTLLDTDIKNNLAYLDIHLHTGKTHQIRAHLAHIGLPILGDGKYGINKINKQFSCKYQQLYSYSLTFHLKSPKHLAYLNEKTFKLKSLPFNLSKSNFNY